MTDFKVGDHVEWHTSQGLTHGEIKRKLTEPYVIKGYQVAASQDNPQYLVVSAESGEEAAHKPEALKPHR